MSTKDSKENPTTPHKSDEGSAIAYNRIRCVVAVMSGKGGVGKSFITSLLASALAKQNYQVGILDADITGPSIPMLFGLHGPVQTGEVGILPLRSRSGIKVISMNLLLASEDQAVIWRGPMIGKAIKQLWGDVMWGDLDYLLVDLPPGTSDAALTIMQSLPVKGLIMVTTPQDLANLIVRKAVHMAQNVGVPIIGVVENMAYFVCPDTGKLHYVFGPSHAQDVTGIANAPLLAQLPIDPDVARLCDAGMVEEVRLKEIPAFVEAFSKVAPVHTGGKASKETTHQASKQPDKLYRQIQDERLQIQNVESVNAGDSAYSPVASQLIETRENMGSIEKPDVRGFLRGPCGDSMEIYLRLQDGIIQEARFTTDGCGATIACGSMLTRIIRGKSLAQANQVTPTELIVALQGLPKSHEHCAKLAVDALRLTINNANKGTQ